MKKIVLAALRGVGKTLWRLGPVGGEVVVVAALASAYFYPIATAGMVDFQPTILRPVAAGLSYLPWWLGGIFGSVLSGVVTLHDLLTRGLLEIAAFPDWVLSFLPESVSGFARRINATTFAWARVLFGVVLIYIEYRIVRVAWYIYKVFVGPWVWMYREDKKDHLQSPHPVYDDRPVIVRREPTLEWPLCPEEKGAERPPLRLIVTRRDQI